MARKSPKIRKKIKNSSFFEMGDAIFSDSGKLLSTNDVI